MSNVASPFGAPVGLGIVGCGIIGRQHMEGTAKVPHAARIVAIADVSGAAVAAAQRDFAIERGYDDAMAVLDDPAVEAVVLALPTAIRGPLAVAAFERGKHVLLEKPTAATPQDLELLIAARGSLAAASCSSRFRATRIAAKATEIVASGQLGEIREIRYRGHRPLPAEPQAMPPAWRLSRRQNGGGILWNWGPYDLDFVLGITGWTLEPTVVFGQSWSIAPDFAGWIPADSDGETHGVAIVRFASGAVLNFGRGEYMAAPSRDDCQIIGSKGSLSLDMLTGPDKHLRLYEAGKDGLTETIQLTESQDYNELPPALIEDFAAAVRHRTKPRTSLENALVVARITSAIRDSAETGVSISLQDLDR